MSLAGGTWENRGVLFPPPTDLPWVASHAALPVAIARGDHHRVLYSGRDAQGRARVGWFDADLAAGRVLAVGRTPALDLGELGAFDDSGVTTSCVVDHGGRLHLYYSGWSLGVTVPFYFFGGLAVSDDGGETFARVSRAPVLERDAVDPFLTASPFVLIEDGRWRMWYVSCSGWRLADGKPRHYYHIRYAESPDGIAWSRHGQVCIDFKDDAEYALARPYVAREDGRYKMWFSARGEAYRPGYAESADGLSWTRLDEAMTLPAAGWDAEMQAYPYLATAGGERWMLYNGNGYGRTGIGLAVRRGD